jgi:hypothetical protein
MREEYLNSIHQIINESSNQFTARRKEFHIDFEHVGLGIEDDQDEFEQHNLFVQFQVQVQEATQASNAAMNHMNEFIHSLSMEIGESENNTDNIPIKK